MSETGAITEPTRVPVEPEYIRALGRAAYNFAYLESGLVWLIETIETGYIRRHRNLTAGQKARDFELLVKGMPPDDDDKHRLEKLAAVILELIDRRNGLLHGGPYTATGGQQRLRYSGRSGEYDWTIPKMYDFARDVENAAIETNGLFHGGRYQAYEARKRAAEAAVDEE